jgi:hypothetical protein
VSQLIAPPPLSVKDGYLRLQSDARIADEKARQVLHALAAALAVVDRPAQVSRRVRAFVGPLVGLAGLARAVLSACSRDGNRKRARLARSRKPAIGTQDLTAGRATAAKINVRGVPITPLPNAMPHNPSFTRGVPRVSLSVPSNLPPCGSKALINPLSTLPTSKSPPKRPQCSGASAMPHGSTNGPPVTSRLMKRPSVVKTLIAPVMAPSLA